MAKNKNSGGTSTKGKSQVEETEVDEAEVEGEETEGNEAAGEAGGNGTTKKYETLIIGVSKARKPIRNAVVAHGEKIGVKTSDLIWHALDNYMKNPPKKSEDVPASVRSGPRPATAAGFWTVVSMNERTKRADGMRVVEVESRGELTEKDGARTFFRYKKGDNKERARAKAQATKAAQSDARMAGITGDISVEELDTAAA